MDFELPEELRLLKKTVGDFVDRELIPIEMKSMDGPIMRPEMRKPRAASFAASIRPVRTIGFAPILFSTVAVRTGRGATAVSVSSLHADAMKENAGTTAMIAALRIF